MVAIFTGAGAGFERGSGSVLGSAGRLDQASLGRNGEQLFLNAATGNLLISQRDEFLLGRGPDAAIARTYNSLGNMSDDNGDNWRQSTDRRVHGLTGTANSAGSTVKRVSADGSEITYTWSTTKGAYVATEGSGAYDKMTYSSGVWTWTDGDGQMRETYALYGGYWRLSQQIDTDGNALTFTYSGANLTRVATQDGSTVDYVWSGSTITQITTGYTDLRSLVAKTLTRTRYAYDAYNRLSSVTVDLNPEDHSVADGKTYVTTYTYHGTSKLVASISQTDGSKVDIAYDASNRVSTLTQTVASGVARTTTLTYGSGYTTITDPSGQATRLDYLSDGSLSKITAPPAYAGAAQQIVQFGYTAARDLASVTDALGNTTTYAYDSWGNVTRSVDSLGNVTTRTYGSRNELLTETRSVTTSPVASASYETPEVGTGFQPEPAVPGMTFNFLSGIVGNNSSYGFAPAPDGDQAAFIQTLNGYAGSISQTISGLTAGTQYTVKFFLASRPGYGAATFNLSFNGTFLGTFTPASTAYQEYSATFTATGSSGTLSFDGVPTQADVATAIDNLTVGISTPPTATTRYVYDAENHLRYVLSSEDRVTEYRYTANGELQYRIEYPEHSYVPPASLVAASASYETPEVGAGFQTEPAVPGMTFNFLSGIVGNNSSYGFAPAPDGDQAAFIQTLNGYAGSISQTISGLTAGTQYTVKFFLASRPGYGAATFDLWFGNSYLGTFTPASTTYQEYSATFTATGSSGTLSFDGLPTQIDVATAIDGLRVLGPAPATATPTEADLNAWRDAIVDRSSTKIRLNSYDARGNLTTSVDYGSANTGGNTSSAEGYSRSFFVYDQAGQLISRWADGKNADSYVYDGMGRIVASTDVHGGTTSFVFNDVSMQTVVTLASGLVQTSTYNKAGERVSFTETGSNVTPGTAFYKYDQLGRLRQETDATGFNSYHVYDKAGRKVADVNHYGDVVEYRYDANNRLAATARYRNRLSATQLATLADPNAGVDMASIRPAAHVSDVWTWQVHDKEGRLIQAIEGDGSARIYEYDHSSRLIRTTAYATKLSATQVSGFKTTAPNALMWPPADSAKDSVARNFYDTDGLLVGVLDGEGHLSRIVYDAAGQKIEEVAFFNATAAASRATGTFDQLLGSFAAHANDRRTRFVYDGQGQLRYQVDALNQVTEFVYDVAGQATQTIRYAGSIAATSDYTYDNVKTLVATSGLATHAATRKSWSVYDAAGRPAYSIDPEGAVVRFIYDAMGRVVKTVHYAGKRATTSLPTLSTMDTWAATQETNAANRITRNYYTARGELRFTVDAEGYVSRNEYDAEGRIKSNMRWTTAITVDDSTTIATIGNLIVGTSVETLYRYDAAGRLSDVYDGEGNRRHLEYYASGTLAWDIAAYGQVDESRTLFIYDNAGRVTTEYRAYDTPEQTATSFAYDGLGNLLGITDPNGNLTSRAYDKLGRMTSQTNAENGTVSYQYNAFDETVKVTDARGYASYNYYDKLGRLTAARDAEGYVTHTTYTVFGDIASVTRRYNKASNTASVNTPPTVLATTSDATTSFEYDKLGRLTKATDAEGAWEQYTLDAFGGRTNVRNKLSGVVINTYDRRGLLVAERLPAASVDSNGTTVSPTVTNRFEYDARGNRTKMIEADGLAEKRTTIYVYDKADRLIETRKDNVSALSQTDHATTSTVTPTEYIRYDQRGNVIETVDANGARTFFYYDKLNRKIADISALGTLSTYAYDKNGNLLTSRVYGTPVPLPAMAGGAQPPAPGGEVRQTSYTYDKLGRLKTTGVSGVRTGAWNGTVYATSVGSFASSFDYDAAGNLIKATDARGGVIFSYYDKLGRKTAQVDQENYLTSWTLDPEGNVLTERRAATKAASVTTTAPPTVATHAEDRITKFAYDKNGRRKSEQRMAVATATVSSTGALSQTVQDPTIFYLYNGLGQVTRKTEATGEYVDYEYDVAGRLKKEIRMSFVDQTGISVRPTVDYSYNGLGNLTRTRQGGTVEVATDRVTRYSYGTNGRLASMTDAAGAVHSYYYDAAGNVLRQDYRRQKSDGSSTLEGILYKRDLLGRVTSQGLGAWTGTVWNRGDSQNTAYNAYGEVSQRGINGLWQEQFAYDTVGRLWRTNSGDGVWRYFIYDANGNKTLALESEGTNLANKTIDQVLAIATVNGSTTVGGAYVDGINATIDVYDKRGQATATRLPKRQLSETATPADLTASRGYNAFGEVVWEKDLRGYETNYLYNTMGRLIEKKSPTVATTNEGGVVSSIRPIEMYHYDVSGRMVGVRDANDNLLTRSLLAGTGYNGAEAIVAREYHADGGVIRNEYDLFGDLRETWDELNRVTKMSYDAMGRLVQATRPGGPAGLVDNYAYDLLGQRIKHWNSLLGTGNVETTDYDMQGRIVRQVAFGGDATTTSYIWDSTLVTSGMGTFGGWSQTTTYANSKSMTEKSDLFGHDLHKSDLGGNVVDFSYDLAGRMTQRSGAETLNYAYLNTGLLGSTSNAWGSGSGSDYELAKTVYGYDAAGNKTSEVYTREGGYWRAISGPLISGMEYVTYSFTDQNAAASYDALGRMTSWSEAGSATTPASSIQYEYDAVGNVRRTRAEYRILDAAGDPLSTVSVKDYWYRYDAMNRVVTAKGMLDLAMIGSVKIRRGYTGNDYAYDKAGQRAIARWTTRKSIEPSKFYDMEHREDYGYHAAGNLATVHIAQSGYTENVDGTPSPTPLPATGALKASYTYDPMGRLTGQIDWLGNGTNAGYDRSITYNAKGQVASDSTAIKQASDTYTTNNVNNYGTGAAYALGAIVYTTTSNLKNNVLQTNSRTDNTYHWYDGAVQATVTHKPNTAQSTIYTTTYSYGGSGALASIHVADGRPRTITFTNDMNGQVIRRDESDTNTSSGDPHEIWYRFNGKQLGYVGNNGTLDTDYQTSIGRRTQAPPTTPGAFRFGSPLSSSYADFDLSVDPINSYSQGGAGGSYTVRAGDTLGLVAAQLWGDASLWFKLAEANGMSAANALSEGQRLTIPAGVMKSQHNASTFKPYDPAEAIGDASPTAPRPPKKNKCGAFGQVLLVVISVAVSFILPAVAPAVFGGFFGGIGAAMIGNAASQAVGVATGIQDEFSWKGVAMAGIAAGVGGGLGRLMGETGIAGSRLLTDIVRGAAGSAITQGIGVATGLQDKFDWAGVAAAGISAGAGGAFKRHVLKVPGAFPKSAGGYAQQAATNMAGAIAGAAARSLIEGSDFGDTILAALPGVIGSTIGGIVGSEIERALGQRRIQDEAPYEPASEAQRAAYRSVIAQGKPEEKARFIAMMVALREQVEEMAPTYMTAGGQQAVEFQQFKEAFDYALIMSEVYFDRSIPELLPSNVRRLEAGDLSALGLNQSDFVDTSSGYFGALYINSDSGQYIYSNRGTEDGVDWVTNFLQATGFIPDQYTTAIEVAFCLESILPNKITYVGHSLGGGLAAAQALVVGAEAVVFNSAGVHDVTLSQYYGRNFYYADQLITAYHVDGEALNFASDKGKYIVAGLMALGGAFSGHPIAGVVGAGHILSMPAVQGGRHTLPATYLASRGSDGALHIDPMRGWDKITNMINLHGTAHLLSSMVYQFGKTGRWP